MGFTCRLSPLGTITYRAELDGGMTEHELVHVFRGLHDGEGRADADEAEDYRWASLAEIRADSPPCRSAIASGFASTSRRNGRSHCLANRQSPSRR